MEKRLKLLRERMDKLTREDSCVAFSGGVDSSLLLKTAVKAADKNHTKVYEAPRDDLSGAGAGAVYHADTKRAGFHASRRRNFKY